MDIVGGCPKRILAVDQIKRMGHIIEHHNFWGLTKKDIPVAPRYIELDNEYQYLILSYCPKCQGIEYDLWHRRNFDAHISGLIWSLQNKGVEYDFEIFHHLNKDKDHMDSRCTIFPGVIRWKVIDFSGEMPGTIDIGFEVLEFLSSNIINSADLISIPDLVLPNVDFSTEGRRDLSNLLNLEFYANKETLKATLVPVSSTLSSVLPTVRFLTEEEF